MAGMAPHGGCRLTVPALADTTVMTVAMMGPATLGGVRHTMLNSLRRRRRRAAAEYTAAYLSVWLAFGVAALAATALLPQLPGQAALGTVLLVAAGWQFTPYKRRWLRDCHLSVPLPPQGWRAERAALAFGARNGLACLGSCWCLMLVMYAAPAGRLLWSIAVTGILLAERLRQRPGRAVRLAGVALGSAGLWTLVLAVS